MEELLVPPDPSKYDIRQKTVYCVYNLKSPRHNIVYYERLFFDCSLYDVQTIESILDKRLEEIDDEMDKKIDALFMKEQRAIVQKHLSALEYARKHPRSFDEGELAMLELQLRELTMKPHIRNLREQKYKDWRQLFKKLYKKEPPF